jgi:crotonobetainyl-CoA:carnitine CoA-transferase CaiB-like acyl-CoA transferase
VQQRETVYADPQVAAESLIADVEQDGLGAVKLLAPFVRVGGDAPAPVPAPLLGGDTDAVLAELR